MVGVEVFHGKTFEGRITKRKIKVDVSFSLKLAGGANILVLIECKCYSHKVPVDDVEEFHSKLDDIGAQKGIMITTKGYQGGTIKAALGRRIALAMLSDDPERGEISYVVNYAGLSPEKFDPGGEFFSGNVKGLISDFEPGLRFRGFPQLMGMLIVDAQANGIS